MVHEVLSVRGDEGTDRCKHPPLFASCLGMLVQVVQDFEAGLEYAEAVLLKDSRRKGDSKEYLVQWSDGAADSWEGEDNITRALVSAFERERKASTASITAPVDAVPA